MSFARRLLFGWYQRLINLVWGLGLSKIPFADRIYHSIFNMLKPQGGIMQIGDYKMCSNTNGLPHGFTRMIQAHMVRGGWEPETTRIFKGLAKKGDIIVDVGANLGWYTLLSAGIVGDSGKVYAFEPEPTNYRLLTSNIKLNGFNNIIAEQKAVADRNGKAVFYLDSKDIGSHTLYKSDVVKQSIGVESVTLDEYFKGRECPVSIVKLDIEGAEPYALAGMANIIKKNENIHIFMEFYPEWLIRAGIVPRDFASQLLDKFHITAIQDYTRHVRSFKVESVDDLMIVHSSHDVVNLLLEKKN